ncbi:MAG: precorrin-3B C(17)-methyltransferase [Oscillospiraceae bacterium]
MKLFVVGLGPGGEAEMTARAVKALEASEVVAGYKLYLELIPRLTAGKALISTGMRGEVERCRAAVEAAASGKTVAVVSSGDAGVYGMAGLVLQLAEPYPELEIEIVPGVTAACGASALLGAPLTQDFATVSLSDLLTPWAVIEKRLRGAAEGDFVLCLYNPASRKRRDHLARACAIVAAHRPPSTPCGIARNIGREEESAQILTLAELAEAKVDMFTTVVIGNSCTQVINGRLVTPRGYHI